MLIVVTITCLKFVTYSSNYGCLVATWAEFVCSICIVCTVAFTLANRVYALWKGNYIVLAIFFLIMSANILNYLFIYGTALYRGSPVISKPPFTGCAVILNSSLLWISFANTLTFEAVSISLVVYKAWPMARQRDVETPIFSLLLEDGVGYFLAFTASKLFTVGAVYAPTPISPVVLSSYPSFSVAALAINRLFIRLQRATVMRSMTTQFTGASFSIAKYDSSYYTRGSRFPRKNTTVGGTDSSQTRRDHQDDLLSRRSVELYTAEDLHMATTRRDSTQHATPVF